MSDPSTILLDNNALSNPNLSSFLPGKSILLPDAVLLELFAAGEWERSIPQCLAPLAPFASRVLPTTHLGDLLGRELGTGDPANSVVCDDSTLVTRMRRAVIACRDEPHRAVEYFRLGQRAAAEERSSRVKQVWSEQRLSLEMIQRLRETVGRKKLQQLRQNPMSLPHQLESVNFKAEAILSLSRLNHPLRSKKWDAAKMATSPCCWMRLLIADICLAFRRSVSPAFKDAADNELHSDRVDREIVVLGSYADSLLTFDKKAKWLDTALRACLLRLF